MNMKTVNKESKASKAQEGEVWFQCENPDLDAKQCLVRFKATGNPLLEIGTRYHFQIFKPEGERTGWAEGQESKVVQAWGRDLESAEDYMERYYLEYHEKAKLVGMDLEDKCFKVLQENGEARIVHKCRFCTAISKDLNTIKEHEVTHENP